MRFRARATLLAGLSLVGRGVSWTSQAEIDRPGALPSQISLVALGSADVLLDPEVSGPAVGESASAPRGKVADVVFSTADGRIVCAAISVGKLIGKDDRTVLVSATVLRYARIGKEPGLLLRMTKRELHALPDFDVKKDGKEGLLRAVEKARGRTDSSKGREKDGGAPSAFTQTYMLSSRFAGADVSARDALFGKVHDAAVDVATNAITCLVVSRGDASSVGVSLYVVPLRGCQWTGAAGRSELLLGKTIEQLKAAPEYKPSGRALISPEQMRAADAFFSSGKVAGASVK